MRSVHSLVLIVRHIALSIWLVNKLVVCAQLEQHINISTYLETETISGAVKVCLADEVLDSLQHALDSSTLGKLCLEHDERLGRKKIKLRDDGAQMGEADADGSESTLDWLQIEASRCKRAILETNSVPFSRVFQCSLRSTSHDNLPPNSYYPPALRSVSERGQQSRPFQEARHLVHAPPVLVLVGNR